MPATIYAWHGHLLVFDDAGRSRILPSCEPTILAVDPDECVVVAHLTP